jgi:hypothetical protein
MAPARGRNVGEEGRTALRLTASSGRRHQVIRCIWGQIWSAAWLSSDGAKRRVVRVRVPSGPHVVRITTLSLIKCHFACPIAWQRSSSYSNLGDQSGGRQYAGHWPRGEWALLHWRRVGPAVRVGDDASSFLSRPCGPKFRVCGVSVPAGDHRPRGAVVSAVRAVVPRCRGYFSPNVG